MRHFLRIAAFSAITLLTCAVPASCQTAQSLSFVKKLYNDLLGAPPTSNELYSYALLLDMQSIQPEAVSAILTGTKTYRQKQVAHFYQLYLSRPATAFDLDYWVNGPGAKWPLRSVRAAVIGTDEFMQRANDWQNKQPNTPPASQLEVFVGYMGSFQSLQYSGG